MHIFQYTQNKKKAYVFFDISQVKERKKTITFTSNLRARYNTTAYRNSLLLVMTSSLDNFQKKQAMLPL